jgi:fatty acid desaturase
MNDTTNRDRAAERAQARRDAIAFTCTGPLVTAILLVVWAVTGAGYFWPAWPMLGMSIALLVALWRAFGPIPHAGAGDPSARPQ